MNWGYYGKHTHSITAKLPQNQHEEARWLNIWAALWMLWWCPGAIKISIHTVPLCVPDRTLSLEVSLHQLSALSPLLVAMVMDRLAGQVRQVSVVGV